MNILVAEDDVITAQVLQVALQNCGHKVRLARNGGEALTILQSEHFRVVVTDWMMPGMNGIELCKTIRARQWPAYTYVIILSAKREREDRLNGLLAGADDFLVKPLDEGDLITRLTVAERVLAMEANLRRRTGELESMQNRLFEQNEKLADAMAYSAGANRNFADFFKHLPVACYVCDFEGNITDWNEAAVRFFGLDKKDVLGYSVCDVLPVEDAHTHQSLSAQTSLDICKAFADGLPPAARLCETNRDNHSFQFLQHLVPLRQANGDVSGVVIVNSLAQRREVSEDLPPADGGVAGSGQKDRDKKSTSGAAGAMSAAA